MSVRQCANHGANAYGCVKWSDIKSLINTLVTHEEINFYNVSIILYCNADLFMVRTEKTIRVFSHKYSWVY